MNLTTTNYLFPTKEGRFQRWRRLSFCPPCGMGAAARCEGRCPSGAGRETWLLLPEVEGLRPHAPHREGAPPHTPGVYAGLAAPAPTSGPTRPTPGVPFVSRRKEPKACRGCAPGPPVRSRRPFRARCAALRLAPGYLLPPTQIDLPL